PLSPLLLARALAQVVRRHEVLRTTFEGTESGEPRQVVAPPDEFEIAVVDLGSLPSGAREMEAGRLQDAEAGRPFDLAQGPLCRATLRALAGSEHRLLVTMHHIATDGWSVDVLLGEISALYHAGGRTPLPELPIQYADFAAWQRRWLAGPVLEAQLAYWR